MRSQSASQMSWRLSIIAPGSGKCTDPLLQTAQLQSIRPNLRCCCYLDPASTLDNCLRPLQLGVVELDEKGVTHATAGGNLPARVRVGHGRYHSRASGRCRLELVG